MMCFFTEDDSKEYIIEQFNYFIFKFESIQNCAGGVTRSAKSAKPKRKSLDSDSTAMEKVLILDCADCSSQFSPRGENACFILF